MADEIQECADWLEQCARQLADMIERHRTEHHTTHPFTVEHHDNYVRWAKALRAIGHRANIVPFHVDLLEAVAAEREELVPDDERAEELRHLAAHLRALIPGYRPMPPIGLANRNK